MFASYKTKYSMCQMENLHYFIQYSEKYQIYP